MTAMRAPNLSQQVLFVDRIGNDGGIGGAVSKVANQDAESILFHQEAPAVGAVKRAHLQQRGDLQFRGARRAMQTAFLVYDLERVLLLFGKVVCLAVIAEEMIPVPDESHEGTAVPAIHDTPPSPDVTIRFVRRDVKMHAFKIQTFGTLKFFAGS
jgi:hypothetical protein